MFQYLPILAKISITWRYLRCWKQHRLKRGILFIELSEHYVHHSINYESRKISKRDTSSQLKPTLLHLIFVSCSNFHLWVSEVLLNDWRIWKSSVLQKIEEVMTNKLIYCEILWFSFVLAHKSTSNIAEFFKGLCILEFVSYQTIPYFETLMTGKYLNKCFKWLYPYFKEFFLPFDFSKKHSMVKPTAQWSINHMTYDFSVQFSKIEINAFYLNTLFKNHILIWAKILELSCA